jgi:hypothetical protein
MPTRQQSGPHQQACSGLRARANALTVVPGAVAVRDLDENEGTVLYEVDATYPANA